MSSAALPQIKCQNLFTSFNMGGNLTSKVTIIETISMPSFTIKWTGPATGRFFFQGSNDYELNPDGTVKNSGNWANITIKFGPGDDGDRYNIAPGDTSLHVTVPTAAYAIRVFYQRTGGGGTLQSCTLNGKVGYRVLSA